MSNAAFKIHTKPVADEAKRGFIKWYDFDRCFGFISSTSHSEPDVFLHKSVVRASGLRGEQLTRNSEVFFTEAIDPRTNRIAASHVWLIEGGQ